jgi:hypothetical protein
MAFYTPTSSSKVIDANNQLIIGTTYSSIASTQVGPTINPSNNNNEYFGGGDMGVNGGGVAVGCGRMVIGAWRASSGYGKIYIYDFSGNLIAAVANPVNTSSSDYFGQSIAIGSNVIVVTCSGYSISGYNYGAFFIYDLNGNLQRTIIGGTANRTLGSSVSVGSGIIAVSDATGAWVYLYDINGNLINNLNGGGNFHYSPNVWGNSIAIGNGRLVVGDAWYDGGPSYWGKAFVYNPNALWYGSTSYITTMEGTSYGDNFGRSVAVGCGRIVVGQTSKIYIYDLNGILIKTLSSSNGYTPPSYAVPSVAVGSGRIVIGRYSTLSSYLDGGAIVICDLDGNILETITNPGGNTTDNFGSSVAINSGVLVVGSGGYSSYKGAFYYYKLNNTIDIQYDVVLDSVANSTNTIIYPY